jgi:Xaa-Pro aminopeptidase
MSPTHLDRMARASDGAERAGLAGLLVTPSADLLYLAGYDPPPLERLTCLVIRPGADPVLLVPELERPRAADSPVGGTVEIASWRDGEDAHEALSRIVPAEGTYGAGDRMWASHLLALQQTLEAADFVPASTVLGALRSVKDEQEVEALARAARGADEAFRRILGLRMDGRREEEIAEDIAGLLREQGHEEVTFTIVASGPNGASPHHEAGARFIREGDGVVLDFGGRVSRYCSDISRTIAVRRASPRLAEVHAIVREAQEAAFHAVAPGVPAEDVDRSAREIIERAGYGERFLHRTGHGIGLEEHEHPYIVQGNAQPIEPGMCFSIEPGVYLEGELGVRIEDIVTVTETGARRLNRAPRELAIVP